MNSPKNKPQNIDVLADALLTPNTEGKKGKKELMKAHQEPRKRVLCILGQIVSVAASVLAAAFGVQKSKKLQEDAAAQSIWPFVIGGLIFAALFVLAIIAVVALVLPA